MTPIAAILFICGVIALIVGAGRAVLAIRAGTFERPTVPAALWLTVSLYGLVLASVGVVIAR